jgi:hypothetical protein
LARIADQVFLDLAKELDSQGVGRRVAADMFGMALRSYQKKLRRLTESAVCFDKTLWQAVFEFIRDHENVSRIELFDRFARDGEREVGSVINDLVSSGLLSQTGGKYDRYYKITSEHDLRHTIKISDRESVIPLIWLTIHNHPGITLAKLVNHLSLEKSVVRNAVKSLIDDGRCNGDPDSDRSPLVAEDLIVPVGDAQGWEIAVYDHFRAVANAIACKVRSGRTCSKTEDIVGGATLSFDLYSGHPYEARVTQLLSEVRERTNLLWKELEDYNSEHPISEKEYRRLFFYFGQYYEETEASVTEEGVSNDE